MTPIEKAQARVDELEKELSDLRAERQAIETRLVEVNKLEREIDPPFGGYGKMRKAIEELEQAKRDSEDADKAPVAFKNAGYLDGRNMVVSRVTAKRIYVRERGCRHESQFNLDGTDVSRWSTIKIDIAKTFPNGLPIKGKNQ